MRIHRCMIVLVLACIQGLATHAIRAQTPVIEWQRSYLTLYNLYDVKETPDHGFIFTGFGEHHEHDTFVNHGASDLLLLRTDATGKVLWVRSYGGYGYDMGAAVECTPDGGFIVASTSDSASGTVTQNAGETDAWVLKTGAMGEVQWQVSLGGNSEEHGVCIAQTTDSGYLLGATTWSQQGSFKGNHGGRDLWLVKLNAKGKVLWSRFYGGSFSEDFGALRILPGGDFLLCGSTGSKDGDVKNARGKTPLGDLWMLRTDDTGAIRWSQCYGGSKAEYGGKVWVKPDGGFLLAGQSASSDSDLVSNKGGFDFWLVETDSAGKLQWQANYGGAMDEYCSGLAVDSAGFVYMSGFTRSIDGDVNGNHRNYNDYWVLKTRLRGNLLWQRCLGGDHDDRSSAMTPVHDGSLLLVGWASSESGDVLRNPNLGCPWLVKLSDRFNSVDETPSAEPVLFPNPADRMLHLNAPVTGLVLWDVTGREVFRPQVPACGLREIQLPMLKEGVYLLQWIRNGRQESARVSIKR
ncbi:MAG: T9SS type A sorting domain-containing protein [Bacteroidetes bacterium]|nr:T9SS type A sorting domain-containing protein [Bacteroidota bacterium]